MALSKRETTEFCFSYCRWSVDTWPISIPPVFRLVFKKLEKKKMKKKNLKS